MSTSTGIGERIRRYRVQAGLSLGQLAEKSGVSKSYLSSLENESSAIRPSGEKLYDIARTLGVSMADLMGREVLLQEGGRLVVPPSLREFAREEGIPESDVRALARIKFRGEQPKSKERWRYIYNAIRTSEMIDRDEANPVGPPPDEAD
jgi:transcriptional regulator with XRE-family HTH domain